MTRDKRLTLWVASILVLGTASLVALYLPLRKAAQVHAARAPAVPAGDRWPDAAELDHFLAVREAVWPVYRRYRGAIDRSFEPDAAAPLPALQQLVDVRGAALHNHGLDLRRYHDLTGMVYLQWWRTAAGRPGPEGALVERLRAALARAEGAASGTGPAESAGSSAREAERLRERIAFLGAVANADAEAVLAAIPEDTRRLLEARRERIAAADMGLLDAHEVLAASRRSAGGSGR